MRKKEIELLGTELHTMKSYLYQLAVALSVLTLMLGPSDGLAVSPASLLSTKISATMKSAVGIHSQIQESPASKENWRRQKGERKPNRFLRPFVGLVRRIGRNNAARRRTAGDSQIQMINKFMDIAQSRYGRFAMKKCFRIVDTNNNGGIEHDELDFALQRAGFYFSRKHVSRILEKGDSTDGNGSIDIGEFTVEAPKSMASFALKLLKEQRVPRSPHLP